MKTEAAKSKQRTTNPVSVRMSRRYIGQAVQVETVKALEGKTLKIEGDSPQNLPHLQGKARATLAI